MLHRKRIITSVTHTRNALVSSAALVFTKTIVSNRTIISIESTKHDRQNLTIMLNQSHRSNTHDRLRMILVWTEDPSLTIVLSLACIWSKYIQRSHCELHQVSGIIRPWFLFTSTIEFHCKCINDRFLHYPFFEYNLKISLVICTKSTNYHIWNFLFISKCDIVLCLCLPNLV